MLHRRRHRTVRITPSCVTLIILIALVVAPLLAAPAVVQAQDTPQPIALGENKIGELTATAPRSAFSYNAIAGQPVLLEVLSLTDGLVPQFDITTSSGALVRAVGNPNLSNTVSDTITFDQAQAYIITVSSVNGTTGQFVLRLAPGAPPAPPAPLAIDQPAEGTLAPAGAAAFSFFADSAAELSLQITGPTSLPGVSAELKNDAGTVVGLVSSQLTGGAFSIPPGQGAYVLTLRNDSGQGGPLNYRVLLTRQGSLGPAPGATPTFVPTPTVSAVPLPVLPSTGPCVLATGSGVNVNVRRGPGTDYEAFTRIIPSNVYSVMGRNSDSSWYMIDHGDGQGWVAASVTRLGGDCTHLPIAITPAPPLTLTPPATPPIAGDNEQPNVVMRYGVDLSAGFYGQISYPHGDRQDTIAYRMANVPSPVPGGANRPQFRYSIRCTGHGVEYAVIEFSDGSTRACPPDTANFSILVSDSTPRADYFTIKLTGGDNAYVEWYVSFNWYIP